MAAYTATSAKLFLPARIQKKCSRASTRDRVHEPVQRLPALRAQRLDGAVERGGRQRQQQQQALKPTRMNGRLAMSLTIASRSKPMSSQE